MLLEELKNQLAEAVTRVTRAEAIRTAADKLFSKAIDILDGEDVTPEQLIEAKDMEAKAVQQRSLASTTLIAAREDVTRIEKEITDMGKAVMPGSMPGDPPTEGDGSPVLPTAPTPAPANGNNDGDIFDATYVLRYGTEEKAAKAVLTDLYGKNYEQLRHGQWGAFRRYIRRVNELPSSEDEVLLKSIILTPKYAKGVAASGMDLNNLKATMVSAVDILGGYAVPVDFQEEVIKRIAATAIMRPKARSRQTSRDRVEFVKFTGGDDQYSTNVRVTWVDETPTAGTAETNLTLGLEGIDVHNVMAEAPLSRNTVEDNAVDLVAELIEAFSEAQLIDEDNQFITGDGVGKPQGILPGGIALATGVAEVNSLAAADLTADGIIDLVYGIASQYRPNSIFIMERDTTKRIRKLKDAEGQYLWERNMQMGEPDTLLGLPIAENESMPSIAASAYPILFGDPQGYLVVDRIGMTVERFLDSATARTNTVLYIMRRRLGGQLTHGERWAGQLVSA